ncbi:D-hexose-6-phosphate mutarotase, partial [Cronobacter malonaticus]
VSMGAMPDDGYKTFVCVETACETTPQQTREDKPSRLSTRIALSDSSH